MRRPHGCQARRWVWIVHSGHVFAFVYRAELENGLIGHELDHVFIGGGDADPSPDRAKVLEWRWTDPKEVIAELEAESGAFTVWFRVALPEVIARSAARAAQD